MFTCVYVSAVRKIFFKLKEKVHKLKKIVCEEVKLEVEVWWRRCLMSVDRGKEEMSVRKKERMEGEEERSGRIEWKEGVKEMKKCQ